MKKIAILNLTVVLVSVLVFLLVFLLGACDTGSDTSSPDIVIEISYDKPPTAPTLNTVGFDSDAQRTVHWSGGSVGRALDGTAASFEKYVVYYLKTNTALTDGHTIKNNNTGSRETTDSGARSLVITGLESGTIYYFAVELVTTNNGSAVSATTVERAFIKLDKDGNGLSKQDSDWSNSGAEDEGSKWSCVATDAGLVWEIKTDDEGDRDKDNTYKWGGKTAGQSTGGAYDDDWDVLVDAANTEKLCGYSDWRVPTIDELKTLLDASRSSAPYINTALFPNTKFDVAYWSASPDANGTLYAWGLFFEYASDNFYSRDDYEGYVRLVRD